MRLIAIAFAIMLAAGCSQQSEDKNSSAKDTKTEQTPEKGSAPADCPDPDDALVHYTSKDVGFCTGKDTVLKCGPNQKLFNDKCGCGCIDNNKDGT